MKAPWVRILLPPPDNEGPYGAKGMGEIVTNAAMAAIGNAIEDAVGVRLTDLPLTAEKVYAALKERGPLPKPPG